MAILLVAARPAGKVAAASLDIADDLNRRGVALRSITESIDTTKPVWPVHVEHARRVEFSGREIIVNRTGSSLQAAAARGRRGDRATTVGATGG